METSNYWIQTDKGWKPVKLIYQVDTDFHELKNEQIYEGKMAQREDRIDNRRYGNIDILSLLKGKSKEKWIHEFGV